MANDAGHADNTHGEEHGLGHIVPVWILIAVWAALMVFTVITVAVSRVDLGELNMLVAMTIATIKALLVAGFFMHLHWDNKFHALIFFSSLLFVLMFIGMSILDVTQYASDIADYLAR